jgi:metal-responsive CopG/Arc/MetJ family transcriptional regulator
VRATISIPEGLFKQADSAARKLKVSRSQLYTRAIREFLDRRRADAITTKLNEIYSREPATIDPAFARAQFEAIGKERW